MPRTLKSPLKLYFKREGSHTGSFVVIPHSASVNVGNNDSYSVAMKFAARRRVSGHSLTEKWFDDGPPTVNKYPWAWRGPGIGGAVTLNIYDGSANPGGALNNVDEEETHQIVMVRDFPNGVFRTYLDGALMDTDTDSSTGDISTDRHIVLGGRDLGVLQSLRGLLGGFELFSGAMTDQDVADYYAGATPSQTKLASVPLDENEGFIVSDNSGNANHGIIGGKAVWRLHKPDENLARNGGFEFAPPTSIATNATAWINGTAAGGTNPGGAQFGFFEKNGGASEAVFDTAEFHSGSHSLKLSVTDVASWIEVVPYPTFGNPNVLMLKNYAIDAMPNTEYTCTFWMKTEYVSGDATNGAYVTVIEFDSEGTVTTSNSSTPVKTTTGWTQYTINFTTGVDTRWLAIRQQIYGHQGTATLVMNAWYDDFELRLTTPGKILATSRNSLATRTLIT